MNRGFYVVADGISGSGKSTYLDLFRRMLVRKHIHLKPFREIVTTREPYQYAILKAERDRIRKEYSPSPERAWKEVTLFYNDRVTHINDVVQPALARGALVLQDRGEPSTVSQQGAQGAPPAKIAAYHTPILRPDLIYIFHLNPPVARQRILTARGALTASEQDLDYQTRVQDILLDLPHYCPDRKIIFINAERPLDGIIDEMWNHFTRTLHEHAL